MANTLPLLHGYTDDGVVAWRDREPVSAARFAAAAAALSSRLPRRRHVLNLCEDRYAFMLGYAASLLAGQTTLLPPSRAPEAVRESHRGYADVYCLADGNNSIAGLETVQVRDEPNAARAAIIELQVPAEQLAAIVFTSGSTGRPMPHAKAWGSLVAGARALGALLGLAPGTAILGTLSPQHMFGLESTVMLPLQNGLAVHAGRPLLPADVGAAAAGLPRPLWLMTTPLHLRACVAAGIALETLSGALSSTMPLDAELAKSVEKAWRAPLFEIYGSSEAGMIALRRTAAGGEWRLVPGLRFEERDGTLWVQGNHILSPQPVLDRIRPLDAERFLLEGRNANLVKIAGKRSSLEALNAALLALDGVEDGAFFAPEGAASKRLVAFVVAPGRSTAQILAELRGRIDSAFLPRPLHLVDRLPRNDSGKLPRPALAELAAALRRHSQVED